MTCGCLLQLSSITALVGIGIVLSTREEERRRALNRASSRLNINTRLPLTESSPPCRLPSSPWGDATQHSTQPAHTQKHTECEHGQRHLHTNSVMSALGKVDGILHTIR